jgi:hypothetical protein
VTRHAAPVTRHALRITYSASRLALFAALLLAACVSPAATPAGPVAISLTVDGQTRSLSSAGPTVREALAQAGVTLGRDDKVTPAEFTRLADGMAIQVIRVTEQLVVEETTLPFERQTFRNEGLPEGETRLAQIGVNGVQETTYRIIYEDGVQVARNIVKQQTIVEPVPEIVMVGAQASFVTVPVGGSLAYLSAGNAWLMRDSSASRAPLTVSSDLDGRVFALSPGGDLLLFTRVVSSTDTSEAFNTLWLVNTRSETARPIDLNIANVLWAAWSPRPAGAPSPAQPGPTGTPEAEAGGTATPESEPAGALTFAYTTAEPRPTAPGWQANNDLVRVDVDASGRVRASRRVLDASSGGVYGWWGTTFAWAPDGRTLAYSQADTVGVLQSTGEITPTLHALVNFPLYQTFSDWVWTPAIAWSPDQRFLYTVVHAEPVRFEAPEDSPAFDVAAVAVGLGPEDPPYRAPLARQAGMWAAPAPAPAASSPDGPWLAFLQAVSPLESVNSRYYVAVADRDGSNARRLFPPEGEIGLNPQTVAWSPDAKALAVIRGGNLWIVDVESGEALQLTADGLASKPSWAGD